MSKIIITGGTGFLGKAVRKALSDSNDTIIPLRGRGEWDLTKQKHVEYLFAHNTPDVIVHLAAKVGGIGANKQNPGLFMYENLVMGMNLIETARKYGKLKKFIMVGTVCAYPKFTPVPFKEEDIWNGYPEETNAPYGIAKKTLTEMLIAYHAQYGLQSTNLIPVNMYGPNDNFNPESSHVIPALILKIDRAISRGSNNIDIWGTGDASREFLYVDDCAEIIRKSIEKETTPHPINVGTGNEIKIRDLVLTLAKIMGYTGDITYHSDKPNGQPRRCLDVSKAYKVFGFEASMPLYEGLKHTVSWYYRYKGEKSFANYFDHIQ